MSHCYLENDLGIGDKEDLDGGPIGDAGGEDDAVAGDGVRDAQVRLALTLRAQAAHAAAARTLRVCSQSFYSPCSYRGSRAEGPRKGE